MSSHVGIHTSVADNTCLKKSVCKCGVSVCKCMSVGREIERGGARVELAAHRRRLQLCAGERGSRLLLLLGVLCSGRGALPLELGLELSHLPQRTRGK